MDPIRGRFASKEAPLMAFCKQCHLSLGFHISAVFAIVCCYSALCADGYSLYTDSWAVEINGGRHIADKLAKKHGFINAGEVRA